MDGDPPHGTRRAGNDDAAEVVRLRQAMFEAMASAGAAARPDQTAGRDWQPAGTRELGRQLADGCSAAYVVDVPGSDGARCASAPRQLIACAVASLERRLPGPGFPTGLSGSMHTVFVEPAYRRQGLARRVVTAALAWLIECGVETVDLHATPEAERLYRSLGFTEPRSASLRWLDPGRNTHGA